MKIFISVLLAFAFQITQASNHEKHEETGKSHKDWNEVFKQPAGNMALSENPESTQILEPKFLSEVKGTEVTLKWKAVDGAKYHLQVATDPNYKWIVVNEPLVTYTEYALKNLEQNKQYFWRVYTQKPENMKAHTKGPAVSSAFEVK